MTDSARTLVDEVHRQVGEEEARGGTAIPSAQTGFEPWADAFVGTCTIAASPIPSEIAPARRILNYISYS